jgi:hypothetical protein
MTELMLVLVVVVTTPPLRISSPPESVTTPSWTVRLPSVWLPLTVTLTLPVTPVPAEKIAFSPATHGPVATVPALEVLQKLLVPHMPVALALLLPPAAMPLMSQNKSARADESAMTPPATNATAAINSFRRLPA